jgi:hypothetical protein
MKMKNLNRITTVEALKGDFDAPSTIIPANNPERISALGIDRVFWHALTGGFSLKILVLFFAMALWGCQKDKVQTTIIEGRITELGSFEPVKVAGLKLGLYETGSAGYFSSYSTKIAEFTTNDNGEFYFEARLNKNPESYFVELLERPSNYILKDNIRQLSSSVLNLIQFNLNREAWLRVILNNEGGDQFDYFVLSVNGVRYMHTGGGRPSLIRRVPSYDSCYLIFADHRTTPEINTLYKPVVMPNDTLEFEIDLRPR